LKQIGRFDKKEDSVLMGVYDFFALAICSLKNEGLDSRSEQIMKIDCSMEDCENFSFEAD